MMQQEQAVSYSGMPDRRKTRDLRREIVCWTTFNFWEENGRKLGYTSDLVRDARGGPLIDFINSIVACMTEPSTTISGETLKMDIEKYNAFRIEVMKRRQG